VIQRKEAFRRLRSALWAGRLGDPPEIGIAGRKRYAYGGWQLGAWGLSGETEGFVPDSSVVPSTLIVYTASSRDFSRPDAGRDQIRDGGVAPYPTLAERR
jgi:hypothetical protein